MAGWKPAPSVSLGLSEATKRWPERSRLSDGIIGDAAHSARTSDHNPDARGIVHAFDLTHDPDHGVDCNKLALHLLAAKDRRIRYVIWNGRLFRGPWSDGVLAGNSKPWIWEPYRGVNPHTKHMHVSVGYNTTAENNLDPWWDLGEVYMSEADILGKIQTTYEYLRDGKGQTDHPHNIKTVRAELKQGFTDITAAIETSGGGVVITDDQALLIADRIVDRLTAKIQITFIPSREVTPS